MSNNKQSENLFGTGGKYELPRSIPDFTSFQPKPKFGPSTPKEPAEQKCAHPSGKNVIQNTIDQNQKN